MSVTQRADSGEPESTKPAGDTFGGRLSRPERRLDWLTGLGGACVAIIVFWVVRGGLIDDSYITLTYARNLVTHFQWGMFGEEVANSATSPLNVMALAASTWLLHFFIGVDAVAGLGALFVVASAVLAVTLRRIAVRAEVPASSGVLGAALVVCNPLLLSAVGLEMTLASVLLGLLLWASLRARAAVFGIVAGSLVLTRVDLGIFPLLLFAGSPALWRCWWRCLAGSAGVALPWFALSWFALGSAVPDTLLIKQLQDYWGVQVFSNGLLLYLTKYPVATVLSLIAPALVVLVLPFWLVRRVARGSGPGTTPAAWLCVGGLAHYFAYTMLGVPPYHWYYAPSIIALSLSLPLLLPAGVAQSGFLVVGGTLLVAQSFFVVQRGIPWDEAPITTNGAKSAEYARMGKQLGRLVGDATVSSPGEIGTLAYHCECVIVDEFSDRGLLPPKIEERKRQVGPVIRWLIDVNYTHFDRRQRPRPVDFDLRRVDGRGPNPLWNGDSAYHQPAHFVLSPR